MNSAISTATESRSPGAGDAAEVGGLLEASLWREIAWSSASSRSEARWTTRAAAVDRSDRGGRPPRGRRGAWRSTVDGRWSRRSRESSSVRHAIGRGSRSRFNDTALTATMMLDPAIEMAATSGARTKPRGSKTPAAIGSASEL